MPLVAGAKRTSAGSKPGRYLQTLAGFEKLGRGMRRPTLIQRRAYYRSEMTPMTKAFGGFWFRFAPICAAVFLFLVGAGGEQEEAFMFAGGAVADRFGHAVGLVPDDL